MPKVSVILPVYNASKYVREALDSVINQTLRDIEIICINDGSTDNSLEILEEYAQKDARIRIINKENSGYGATVNIGIREATGEYIAIFEPDDILELNIYEILYSEALKYNLDVVKCNYNNYLSQKNKRRRSGLVLRTARRGVFSPKDNLKIFTCHSSVWAGIYRKKFLEENNIFFLETPGASYQDMSFTFKVLAKSERIKLLKDALLNYRIDNPNSSVNNPSKVYCVKDEYDELTKFLDSNKDLKKIYNTQKLVNQYRAYLWNLRRLDTSLQKDFLLSYSQEFSNFYKSKEIKLDFFKSINALDFYLLLNSPNKFYKKLVERKVLTWIF